MARSLRNRYSKSLFGINHQGYYSKEVAYATAADLGAFAEAGLEGQVGIFNGADDTIRSTALTTGLVFYVAQIRDGEVRKTPKMVFGDGNLQITKQAYDAPVKQVVSIGWDGAAGSLNLAAVAAGNEYVLSARDTTPGSQPFPVTEGRAIVRNASGVTEYQIVKKILDDIMNSYDFERNSDASFVVADIMSNGSQSAIGATTIAVNSGSVLVTYSGAHSLTTASYVKIRNVVYKVASVPSATTITLDRPYTGATETALATGTTSVTHGLAAYTDTTTELGIRLTAVTEDTNFVVGVGEDLSNATVVITTAWKQGSGASWQVSAMEDESLVFDGWTTGNLAWVDDFGKPAKFTSDVATVTYNTWFLKYKGVTDSMAYPNELATHIGFVVIVAPSSGTTPNATLDTVLGT